MRSVAIVALLFLSLVPAPMVAAQDAPGTIFFGSTLLSEPAAGQTSGCRTIKHYNIGIEAAAIPDGKAYWDEIPGAVGCGIWFDLVLAAGVTLAGTGQLTFRYACDAFTSPGATSDFRGRLYKNGAQISQVDVESGQTCGTAGATATIGLPTADTSFDAGDTLSIGVVSWFMNTPSAQAKNLHMKVGPSSPATFTAAGLEALTRPATTPSGPSLLFQNVTGPEVRSSRESAEMLNQSDVYNWTAPGGDIELSYSATLTNGSVLFSIVDGANNSVAEGGVTGAGNESRVLANATAGNWTVRVDYSNFTGSFLFVLQQKPPAEVPFANLTMNQTEDGDTKEKGSPGLAPFAAASVLAAVALLLRRRRT